MPTQLVLHTALDIAAERSAVYMQDGKVIAFASLNAYVPHCKFELRDPAPQPRMVAADTFDIVAARTDIRVASFLPRATAWQQLASADALPTYLVYATEMDLRSARQPEVFRLTCQQWEPGDASWPRHVSLSEMRAAFGSLASLQ